MCEISISTNATSFDRRNFLKRAGSIALAYGAGEQLARASEAMPNPVGYATISWPNNEFTQALETI